MRDVHQHCCVAPSNGILMRKCLVYWWLNLSIHAKHESQFGIAIIGGLCVCGVCICVCVIRLLFACCMFQYCCIHTKIGHLHQITPTMWIGSVFIFYLLVDIVFVTLFNIFHFSSLFLSFILSHSVSLFDLKM